MNFQSHMAPVIASAVEEALGHGGGGATVDDSSSPAAKKAKAEALGEASSSSRHHPVLLDLLADELECDADDILDFELQLSDVQPSAIGGARKEFIFSGRLDNLVSCFASLRALIDASGDAKSSSLRTEARSIHWSPYDRVGVVNADP